MLKDLSGCAAVTTIDDQVEIRTPDSVEAQAKGQTMTLDIYRQLGSLPVSLLVAWIVWSFYSRSSYSPADRYATFWPRYWTGSIDSLVLWPLGLVASLLVFLSFPGTFVALFMLVEGLATVLYTVLMHAHYGQTIGKMVTKVQVVDFETEEKITFRQAFIRESVPLALNFACFGYIVVMVLTGALAPQDLSNGKALAHSAPFWILAAVPLLWFTAEVLTMLTNEQRRALHDFIAGTIVVRTNIAEELSADCAEPVPDYPADYPIKCICCGTTIAAFEAKCGQCGWSYKVELPTAN